jgi:hypothetical protein
VEKTSSPYRLPFMKNDFGRWASTLLISAAGFLGPWSAPVLAFSGMLLLLASLTWCSFEFTERLPVALAISMSLVVGTLSLAPGFGMEATYWQTGMLTYLPPLILIALGIASAKRWHSPYPVAALAFAAAGFNESFTAMQGTALLLAILFLPQPNRRLAVGAFAATALSGLIMLAAPGNAVRHAAVGHHPLLWMPWLTADLMLEYLRNALLTSGALVPLLLGAVFAPFLPAIPRFNVAKILACSMLLVLAGIAPAAYGVQSLVDRTMFAPTLAVVLGLFAVGLSLSGWLRSARNAPLSAFTAGLAVAAVVAGLRAEKVVGPMQTYGASWECQHKLLSSVTYQVAQSTLVLDRESNPFPQVWSIKQDPSWQINRCVAAYYGVDAVSTRSP